MKQILILGSGSIAKRFISWVAQKRVADNRYTVMFRHPEVLGEECLRHLQVIDADPSSYVRVKEVMTQTSFSQVFVVIEAIEDARFVFQNVRMIDSKILVLIVNPWEESIAHGEHNITIFDVNDLMAAHLYDHLPNVPLVAQNVGLGQGEIMEILIPFGSAYAYRHVGSILQRKWRIAAIYRDDALLLPTGGTMLRPNDTILAVGKPLVLEGVYKAVNKRIGLFPEPFGKDLYLLIDMSFDKTKAITMIEEALYITRKLQNKHLYIRLLYPGEFTLIEKIKSYESDQVTLLIDYEEDALQTVSSDISKFDIGLVLCTLKRSEADGLRRVLFELRKLIYLFGSSPIYNVKQTITLMESNSVMESISTTAFDLSEALDLPLCLCDFDPEGEFDAKVMIKEHYETLSEIFNTPIQIEQRVANPVREIKKKRDILQVAPYSKEEERSFFLSFLSTDMWTFLLRDPVHPKLLVPYGAGEKEELNPS